MPYRIKCAKCETILFESVEKIIDPVGIVVTLEECPRCGKKLVNSGKVTFKEAEK